MPLGYHGTGKTFTYIEADSIKTDNIVNGENGEDPVEIITIPPQNIFRLEKVHALPFGYNGGDSIQVQPANVSYTSATHSLTGIGTSFLTQIGRGTRISLTLGVPINDIFTVVGVTSDTAATVASSSSADVASGEWAIHAQSDPDFVVVPKSPAIIDIAPNNGPANKGVRISGTGIEAVLVPSPSSAWGQTNWNTRFQPDWICRFTFKENDVSGSIVGGFKLTDSVAVSGDDDAIFFVHNPSPTNTWHVIQNIGGVDTDFDTNVTVVDDDHYEFQIKIDENRVAECFINGILVFTSDVLTVNIVFTPMWILESPGNNAEIRLHYTSLSRVIL